MHVEDITIRRMHIDELDQIQELYAEQAAADPDPLSKLRVNDKQHAWEMRRIRQHWLTEQKYIPCVAVGSEGIIGYAAATIEHQAHLFEIETVANFGELWVKKSYRGRGIGRALVEEVLHTADDLGITWISAHIPADEPLKKFFGQFGFKQHACEMHLCLDDVPDT